MRIESGIENPAAVHQAAERVLYVEGQPAAEGLDVQVLRRLLPPGWAVRAAGNSADVLGAARALAYPHPKWVFVVDRDHHDDQRVARIWDEFNPSERRNLLIWRRKELENLFLEPEWLARSRYLKAGTTADVLREEIRQAMSRRLWGDVVDRVVAQVRYRVKAAPRAAKEPKGLTATTQAEAEQAVLAAPKLMGLAQIAGTELSEANLRGAFNAEVQLVTGGRPDLTWDVGRWRDLLRGKGVFKSLVNRHFPVEVDARAQVVTSKGPALLAVDEALVAVAEDLFEHHRDHMPQDFKDLLARLETVK